MKVKLILFFLFLALLTSCAKRPVEEPNQVEIFPTEPTKTSTPAGPTATPLPERPTYMPGELVEYTAQSGDTLTALAARFNTSQEEIRAANPGIPENASTMPPGMPMQIPIYYRNFWGTPFQIIPDSQFINGPAAVDFDVINFTAKTNGWINRHREYALGEERSGPELINLVATNYSISPRLLLAVSEYLANALSYPALPEIWADYPLRYQYPLSKGYYRQLLWAADQLNQGYYEYRTGNLLEHDLADGTLERPDPWQNAATVSLQRLFSLILPAEQYRYAISPEGFAKTWKDLYDDPWETDQPHIPGSLTQPGFVLPYSAGETWAYTGGPHTAWGSGAPAAAIDFAPASDISGCYRSNDWTTAVADGMISRAEPGIVMLDLDKDGDERTGWVVFYLHVESRDQVQERKIVSAGDPLGHPSCEGGDATGTHVHMARKYNGEWIIADSEVPFVLEGWRAVEGERLYEGTLVRFEKTITACECSTAETILTATGNVDGRPVEILPTPTP
jgi:murein DD-endopeptidase MepM/ murein hydrolase activator NlpD